MLVRKVAINEEQVRAFLENLFEEDLHAKRVLSLSHATLGLVHAASLSVHAIGQALAWVPGGIQKHGIKQVDRRRRPVRQDAEPSRRKASPTQQGAACVPEVPLCFTGSRRARLRGDRCAGLGKRGP